MLKSNEKIQIESHHTDNVSYDGNKDTEFTLVKEESIKINETLQNESHWGLCGKEFQLVNIPRIHMKTLHENLYKKTIHKLKSKSIGISCRSRKSCPLIENGYLWS